MTVSPTANRAEGPEVAQVGHQAGAVDRGHALGCRRSALLGMVRGRGRGRMGGVGGQRSEGCLSSTLQIACDGWPARHTQFIQRRASRNFRFWVRYGCSVNCVDS